MAEEGFVRADVYEKLTGHAQYADDIYFPHMLYAVTVHAPHAHARILSIDVEQAKRMPGVAGVYTAADIPGENQQPADKPMLADQVVCSAGDGVAVVAAETLEQARAAAKKVWVEYQVLPAIFDPDLALQPDSVPLHGDSNLACEHIVSKGDLEKGFAQADVILEREYQTQRIQHSAIEADVAVVVPEHGGITVYVPCKFPYNIKNNLARTCGLPQSRVRVIQPAIGGSFGGKDIDIIVVATRAAMVALATNRPCKMTWTREECMIEGTKRHPFRLRYKIGAKRDGKITAVQILGTADAGAYRSRSLATIWRAAVEATGPYEIENVHTHIRAAFTNHVYSDAVRGFGSPQVDFASESLMDELAQVLGMDPLAIRRKNMLREGSIAATGQKLTQVSLPECLDRLEREFPLGEPEITPEGKYRARGIACLHRGESYGAASRDPDVAGTDITVRPDGSVNIYTSISEVGQGTHAVMAHICAQLLGVPDERVTISPVDTAYVPDSGATAGSRGTISGGNAVRLAVLRLRERIAGAVSAQTGDPAEEIIFADGCLYRKDGTKLMTFDEAIALCHAHGVRTDACGQWVAPQTSWDFAKGQGNTYYAFSYGAAGAEVEIDPVSGQIDVTRLICLHDIGKIYNYPEACGQITGGIAMALGYTLMEEVEMKDGQVKSRNFDTYLLPTAMDAQQIQALPLAVKEAENPLGVHGVGEASTALVAPAVANAVARATGIRLRSLPLNLEKVRAALDRKGENTDA